MTEVEIKDWVLHNYGLEIISIKGMAGYESANHQLIDISGNKYVFKIHSQDFEDNDVILAENEVLKLMNDVIPNFFSQVTPNLDGNGITLRNGQPTRILSFLEGEFLAEIDIIDDYIIQLGTVLARMNQALEDKKYNAIAARYLKWDLQYCLTRKEYHSYIQDSHKRSKAHHFFLLYQEHVQPIVHTLRKGMIHGDANDWNVLVRENRIAGIIDFGDMAYAPIINELAIAIPYAVFGKDNPLASAALMVEAYHKVYPLKETELDILYYLIGARMAVSVSHSAYFNRHRPDDDYVTISEQPVWDLLDQWISINPIKAANIFRASCGFARIPIPHVNQEVDKRKKHLSQSLSLSYDSPIQMSGAAFQYMYARNGNTFLDAYNNIPLVGHNHPRVVEAGQRQMARLNTNTRYLYDGLNQYAERLLSTFPSHLNKIFFVNSGSAASDLAMRMAKNHKENAKIAVMEHGYHGNTFMGIDISSYKFDGKGGNGAKDFILKLDMPDLLRGKYCLKENPESVELYVRDAVSKLEEYQGNIAAFIAEPIMGCGGQIPLPEGYLKAIFDHVKAQGGWCIVDEVQIGFGRVGTHFWGFEQHQVEPDMVILGKPMGNGHPIGAVVCTEAVAESFENGMEFFSSFGGNPVSCSIGLSVLDVIEDEQLQKNSLEIGNYIMTTLKEFQNRYDLIADVRGSGLFWGMELMKEFEPATVDARNLKNWLREKNILISTDGPDDNVIKSKPPLCFNRQNADELLGRVDEWFRKQ